MRHLYRVLWERVRPHWPRLVLLRLAALALLVPSEATAMDIPLSEPGFESALSGWTIGSSSSIQTNGTAHTGAASVRLNNNGAGAWLYQITAHTIEEVDVYTLHFWVRDSGNPGGSEWLAELVYEDALGVLHTLASMVAPQSAGWVEHTLAYTVAVTDPCVGRPLGVRFGRGRHGIVLDDVSLEYKSALVGYWKLDETAGAVAADSSGWDHHGTLTNMTASWVAGYCGGGLEFDGIDDEVIVPDADPLDDTPELTVMFWCYPYTLDWLTRGVISKRQNAFTDNSWAVLFWLGPRVYVDIEGIDDRFYCSEVMQVNQWRHVAVVYDGALAAGVRVSVYIDGTLERTAYESAATIPNTDSPLVLGDLNGGLWSHFAGVLDEVRVYRRALAPAEILTLMNCQGATQPLSVIRWREVTR